MVDAHLQALQVEARQGKLKRLDVGILFLICMNLCLNLARSAWKNGLVQRFPSGELAHVFQVN